MKASALIAVAMIIAAATLTAQERKHPVTALEFLKAFEPPHNIDRNPDREYIPKGQAMVLDGGTRITIIRAADGQKIAVSYYGMNRQLNPDRDGLLSFSGFSDELAYTKPSFRLKRLQMVVSFHFWYSYRGLEPRLQRAHAGHTQVVDDQSPTRRGVDA